MPTIESEARFAMECYEAMAQAFETYVKGKMTEAGLDPKLYDTAKMTVDPSMSRFTADAALDIFRRNVGSQP